MVAQTVEFYYTNTGFLLNSPRKKGTMVSLLVSIDLAVPKSLLGLGTVAALLSSIALLAIDSLLETSYT
jgi:hypothetical protein